MRLGFSGLFVADGLRASVSMFVLLCTSWPLAGGSHKLMLVACIGHLKTVFNQVQTGFNLIINLGCAMYLERKGVWFPQCLQDLISARGGPDTEPFLASLNVFEIEMRSSYFERPRFSGQAVQLNQNPSRGHAMASNDLSMHTLIHNCNLKLVPFRLIRVPFTYIS